MDICVDCQCSHKFYALQAHFPMSTFKGLYYLSIFLALMTGYGCQKVEESNPDVFFTRKEFNGNFCLTASKLSPDSAVRYIHDRMLPKWYGNACESIYYHFKEGTPDSLLFRYIDLCEQTFPHDTILVFTKALRGKLSLRRSQYDTALTCLKEAYNISMRIHSDLRTGDTKAVMGELYSRQGNYPEAIKMLLEAYTIYYPLPITKIDARLIENIMDIGNAYSNSNDFVSAQVWYQRAWDFIHTYPVANGYLVRTSAAMANNYLHLNQLDSAKVMIDTAFYFQNLYQYNYDEAFRYLIRAKVLLKQGDCHNALANFWVAQSRNLKTSDLVIVNRFVEGIGDGYLCLGRLDSAIWLYQKALITPDTAHQAVIHAQLGIAYAQQGNYGLAFKHEQESNRLSNRVFTLEKDKAIGQLQAQNDIERRERLFAEERNKNKITRLLLIVGMLLLSLLVLIGFNQIRRQKQAWLLAEQDKVLLQKEKELVEAREALKTKALVVAAQKLDSKERALEESNKQLNLKDLMIQELEMRLTKNTQKEIDLIEDNKLQNLKILTTDDWRTFRKLFEQRYPDFFDTLVARFPKLSAAEIRLLVLIKIGFDANEMANILGISSSSVYKSRYRLRKKLGLVEEDDLEMFINAF